MADSGEPPISISASAPVQANMAESQSPARCAVLVAADHGIDPACESALRALEERGYRVTRGPKRETIDQTRSEMATAALAEGFAEILWIDPDVQFHPNDVERVRSPGLPIVCGLYPHRDGRQIAGRLLPGTDSLVLGAAGSLTEVLYFGLGFMLIRQDVFKTMQRQFRLPRCNGTDGRSLVPYFAPLWKANADGSFSYLSPDFAFCERARQCGYRIQADTTIRLWRIAPYAYGWEDVWQGPRRFRTFHVTFGEPSDLKGPEAAYAPTPSAGLEQLRRQFPWPAEPPDVRRRTTDGWLHDSTRQLLRELLTDRTQLIVEVGSWLGLSTRFLADEAPHATVVAIDHWKGSSEHQQPKFSEILPVLYETFLANCWDYRQRIVPIRTSSIQGLKLVAGLGLTPDLVYIDAEHTYEAVVADLEATLNLFSKTVIVGDDWNWPGVQQAVREVAERRRLSIYVEGVAWRLG
jgi:predicted O-methyltransferase YrrM